MLKHFNTSTFGILRQSFSHHIRNSILNLKLSYVHLALKIQFSWNKVYPCAVHNSVSIQFNSILVQYVIIQFNSHNKIYIYNSIQFFYSIHLFNVQVLCDGLLPLPMTQFTCHKWVTIQYNSPTNII